MKKLYVFISMLLFYFLFWGYLTNGWKTTLGTKDKLLFCSFLIIGVETFALVELGKRNVNLRLSGNQNYVNYLKRKEDQMFSVFEENLQLQRDLAAMQGKSDMDDIYMGNFTSKPIYSNAVRVNDINGKLESRDGMTKADKSKLAYRLYLLGASKSEIAKEVGGVSTPSIGNYISEGKKLYLDGDGEYVETGNGLELGFPDPYGNEELISYDEFRERLSKVDNKRKKHNTPQASATTA